MKYEMQQLFDSGMNYHALPGLKFIPNGYDSSWRKDKILDATCEFFNMSRGNIYERTRKASIVRARQIAIFLLHKHGGMNKSEIAELFDCDHTSCIHSIRKVTDLISIGDDVKNNVAVIENRIFS